MPVSATTYLVAWRNRLAGGRVSRSALHVISSSNPQVTKCGCLAYAHEGIGTFAYIRGKSAQKANRTLCTSGCFTHAQLAEAGLALDYAT